MATIIRVMGDFFTSDVIEWVLAPLVVGVVLWMFAEVVRSALKTISDRRQRRMRIVSLMGQAESLVVRAVRDGLYDEAYLTGSMEPLAKVREQYDDITVEALALFTRREHHVAFWAAVEFYAGFDEPLRYLTLEHVPRKRTKGEALLHPGSAGSLWYPPRPGMLVRWADRRGLWIRGNARGPGFGDSISNGGDKSRHEAVTPNACMPGDILLPFAWRSRNESLALNYAPFIRESGL